MSLIKRNIRKSMFMVLYRVFVFTLLVGCSDDSGNVLTPTIPTDPQNQAPEAFGLTSITNGATNVDVEPNFSWVAAADPDSDAVTYDFYLDTNEDPTTIIGANISGTSFQAQDRLNLLNQYYWKVVAKDTKGNSTQSNNTYNFTTRNLNFPTIPLVVNADFSKRTDHTTTIFNNKLWVIGGNISTISTNDVWNSSDGIIWTNITTNAGFLGRSGHTTTVFDDKLWVIGGTAGTDKNDVWFSTDGITWTEAISNAAFSKRNGHTSIVFDNKLWVIGGLSKSDVWYSDNGISWTLATANAAFSDKGRHTSVIFDDKLWVIGGQGDNSADKANDAWYSIDGSTWTQATASAEFSKRSSHTSVVFDNKIWLFGGAEAGTTLKNDIWFSLDGITWTEAISNASFSRRNQHSTNVFNDKIWLVGGNELAAVRHNDIWVFD